MRLDLLFEINKPSCYDSIESPNGWGFSDDNKEPIIAKSALPPLIGKLPPIESGMVRLYRGTDVNVIPHRNAFFCDDRGLDGVASVFAKLSGRYLVYVDVPIEIAKMCLVKTGVTDGEYSNIPLEYREKVRIYHR